MEILELLVFTLTASFGWATIAYEGYALPRGWPVGRWFAGGFSWLQGLGYIALLGGVVASAYTGAWWYAVLVVAVANVVVRLSLRLAGRKTPLLCLLGLSVGIPLSTTLLWQHASA